MLERKKQKEQAKPNLLLVKLKEKIATMISQKIKDQKVIESRRSQMKFLDVVQEVV